MYPFLVITGEGDEYLPARSTFRGCRPGETVRQNLVTVALVFLLGSPTFSQPYPQPVPGTSEGALFAGAEASQASPLPPTPEKTRKKEGSERIFGIFPAFNVSNQVIPGPLTDPQKFTFFARSTHDPVTLISPALKVPLFKAAEPDSDLGTGFGALAKRYGILLADGASSRFFRGFFFPTILNEDPRYFRRAHGTFGSRLGYGVSRVFITRTDSGNNRFNWSRLLGSAVSAGLSNTYDPDSQRGASATLFSFGLSYASEAGASVFKEFGYCDHGKVEEYQEPTVKPGAGRDELWRPRVRQDFLQLRSRPLSILSVYCRRVPNHKKTRNATFGSVVHIRYAAMLLT